MKNSPDNKVAPTYVPQWRSSTTSFMGQSETGNVANDEEEESTTQIEYSSSELPIFADEANRLLHAETKDLQRKLISTEKSINDESSRVATMNKYIESIRAEIEHTNNFLSAKNREIHAEQHLVTLSLLEKERIQQEITRYSAKADFERNRLKAVNEKTVKLKEDLDKFKSSMNWNQEELEQWATAAAQKEDDNFALQSYLHSDEVRVKELAMALENLTLTAAQRRAELDNEITETHASQVELERTAHFFKLRQAERNRLIAQWKSTIEKMQQRDEEVDKLSRGYAEQSALKKTELKELKLIRARIQISESTNNELQRDVDDKIRLNHSKRLEHSSMSAAQQSFLDELELIEYNCKACMSSLLTRKMEFQVASLDLDEKKGQLAHCNKRCLAIGEHLEDLKKMTAGKEGDMKKMESFASDTARQLVEAEKNVEKLKHFLFKESQILNELRQEEKNLTTEIQSTQSMTKVMIAKVHSVERDKFRQQELLDNSRSQLELAEQKVARGLGERSVEETKLLQSRINDLEGELVIATNKKNEILQRSRNVASELKGWARQKEQRSQDEKVLLAAICEVELELSSLETQKKSQISNKEELMMSEDLLQLEFRRLRDRLAIGSEEVFNLESKLRQLEDSASGLKAEMLAQLEIKAAQARLAEEDRHKAAIELGKRKIVVEKLQSKYDTIIKNSKQDLNGTSSNRSQVLSLIAAAQKREELLREGDDLDKQIRLKEREFQSMKRTLEHIQAMNSEYRVSLSKAEMKSVKAKELHKVEADIEFARKKLAAQRENFHVLNLEHARVSSLFDNVIKR